MSNRKFNKACRSAAAYYCALRASEDEFIPNIDTIDLLDDACGHEQSDLRDDVWVLSSNAFSRAKRIRYAIAYGSAGSGPLLHRDFITARSDAWAEAEAMIRTGLDPWG